MNEREIIQSLKGTGVSEIKYFTKIGSTNDIALEWAKEGAPEFSLVVADEQSAGRGRLDRKWVTKPGKGLAFSLVLRPRSKERVPFFSALGGIAVCNAMIQEFRLPATIKWPNDILVQDKKICGILAEAEWDEPPSVVLGIGINVGKGSIPTSDQLNFPASTLENEIGHRVSRTLVLAKVVKQLTLWRDRLETTEFFTYWNEHLSFVGKPVQVTLVGKKIDGILKGINAEGNLQIQRENGTTINVEMGDVQLRPVA